MPHVSEYPNVYQIHKSEIWIHIISETTSAVLLIDIKINSPEPRDTPKPYAKMGQNLWSTSTDPHHPARYQNEITCLSQVKISSRSTDDVRIKPKHGCRNPHLDHHQIESYEPPKKIKMSEQFSSKIK